MLGEVKSLGIRGASRVLAVSSKGNGNQPNTDITPSRPTVTKIEKMEDFFNQPGFGRKLLEGARKTSKRYQGQTVFKATEKIGDNIKKVIRYIWTICIKITWRFLINSVI